MPPFVPSFLLVLLLAGPALLTPSTSQELEVRGERTTRDTKQDSIKVVISEGCATHGGSSDSSQGGKEMDLAPGAPLVLTHRIQLVPSGSGSGSCGCEADFAALRERLERLEREVSALREKCGGAEGGCCTSKESKGAACSIKPEVDECPNECSDQGRCVDGKCVCFPGFSGPDCSQSNCPGDCNDKGRCVNGQCVCDPGFSGPDCSQRGCPNNCNNRGRCVNGRCVCNSGFTGPSCSDKSCPGNCNNKGRCVNGQCMCNAGFTGPDCSERTCPDNCNNHGRCVDGRCVCNSGFIGADCSETSCPGNCNNKGRCVNGQCTCDPGFTGPDCSERTCPDNCNNHGRCVNGRCVCNSGFTGADCSETSCPGNCNSRGRCVNGQCMCDDGFTGPDCSKRACPDNCNNRGRCVDGQCICKTGFTGPDCSVKACPKNCSNHGKCVNGKCVCDVGFVRPDCATNGCPSNCNNKGRCIKGRCVCRRGFTGPDCSQCEAGMTGPNCDIVMSGVSQLSTRNITETSVTLIWTPPPVQYQTYHIIFTSQKDSDQQITVQVEGSLTSYTQTGLAAGQEYTVTVTGETDGRTGAQTSTDFMTLTSGPTNLQVVKTSTTSAVVQWEQPQGEIDRYRLTVSPNDGVGRSHEMTLPPDRNSAHIEQLEAGRLYDIILVAEKGTSQSEPATTQATPGQTLSRVTMTAVTTQVTPVPGQDVDNRDGASNLTPDETVYDQQGRREDESEVASVKVGGIARSEDPSATVTAITKPLVSRKYGVKPKPGEKPILPRKPNAPGLLRFNATRVGPGGKKVGPGPSKKPLGRNPIMGAKKKAPIVTKKLKPVSPIVGDRTLAMTVKDHIVDSTSTERGDDKNTAIISPVGIDSGANNQSGSEGPNVTLGSKQQPDVGMAGAERESAEHPVSSETNGTGHTHGMKCINKVKVTHIRLPHKDRVSGYGTMLRGKPNTHHSSSETEDGALNVPVKNNVSPSNLQPSSAETKPNDSQDPLHQLLTDTFDSLNVKTFSVHLSKPSNLSLDAETVRKQILSKLKPLSSSSSSSSSTSSSLSLSSAAPLSSSSSSSLASPSLASSSSIASSPLSSLAAASSSTSSLSSSPSSLPPPPPPSSSPSPLSLPSSSPSSSSLPSSSSSPSSEKSDSVESNEPEVDTSKHMERPTDVMSLQTNLDKKLTSKEGGIPLFHRQPPKGGYSRRPRPNMGPFQNRTRLNLKPSYRPYSPLHLNPRTETETGRLSSSELSSFSERDSSGNRDRATTLMSLGTKQNQTKTLTEEGGFPIHRLPLKRRFPHHPYPNIGPFQNRTRPNLRLSPHPSHSLNPDAETEREHISSSKLPSSLSSSSASKESYQVEGKAPEGGDTVGTTTLSLGTELNQTLRESGVSPFRRPPPKVGYPHRPHPNMRPFQNRTRQNLRPPQLPHRGPIRKPFPPRKLNEGNGITVVIQPSQSGEQDIPGIPINQSRENEAHSPTQGIQTIQSGEQDTTKVIQNGQSGGQDDTLRIQTSQSGKGDHTHAIQTTQLGEEETIITDSDSDSDIHKGAVTAGKPSGTIVRGRPAIKQGSSDTGHGALKPTTLLKRKPPPGRKTAQGHIQMRNNIGESQKRHNPKTDPTGKGGRVSKTGGSNGSDISPSVDTGEPLDYVGVRNLTSDGFMLVWDTPEGKYKNFVVTRKEQDGKDEQAKEKEEGQGEEEAEENPKEDEEEGEQETTKGKEVENGHMREENTVSESDVTQTPGIHSSATAKHATGSDKSFTKVLPGSARSFPFENLPPQTEFTVTLLGKGPGLLSRLHKLVISTGPEPPTNLVFSGMTENSLTVSWTKPKSPVSSFKVTYTHTEDGEPVSVSVGSEDSTLGLSQLSPGSSYEVSVISVLGLDESDPIKDFVMTLPDPPTDLQAINVTDTNALLLWRPALADVDKYTIVYGTGKGSDLKISVSGNAAEQQLGGLEGSTTYTVTITSQLGSLESSPAAINFTTTSGSGRDGEGPRDLQASEVSPRTALLSWKPPSTAVGSYKLTYQTEGQEMKEVTVDTTATEYKLTRLHPGSKYTVQLQVERGGHYSSSISAEFTTGALRFPFPTDCSQELLNGIRESGEVEVFPQGKQGTHLMVYCDMETDGGGWMVFQRRKDGSVDFFRGWKDYIQGFGDLSGEFWLGLEKLHNLTSMTKMSLRVDLRAGDESVFAKYSTFEVAKKNYRLTVAGYSGTAGDSMTYHNNRLFSTKDRDPTPFITRCAMSYRGGWWYKNCHEANLNGLYGIDVKHQGVIWTSWKGKEFSIPFTEMKMRPAAFIPPARG